MKRWMWLALSGFALAVGLVGGCGGWGGSNNGGGTNPDITMSDLVVVGFNELGMHCMSEDFSHLMVLPPFNTLRAQVIRRGEDPEVVQSGVTVDYRIPGNTHSADKTNFWTFAEQLLGQSLAPNIGITGNGMSGTMAAKGDGRYEATGVPVTPIMDNGTGNIYPLAALTVTAGGRQAASTEMVAPVSWEINCNLCHQDPAGADVDILRAHDERHGTDLSNQTPVACGSCHQQPSLVGVLGPGNAALPTLSRAMHHSHASRMAGAGLAVSCYACHPGVTQECQRDVHKRAGKTCTFCHGAMTAVAATTRRPWVDEPRCADCHSRGGFEFEQPGTLFRESRGHNGVYCTTCHNTPHAIVPTVNPEDNVQNIGLQGHSGPLNKCSVCHDGDVPDDGFNHTLDD